MSFYNFFCLVSSYSKEAIEVLSISTMGKNVLHVVLLALVMVLLFVAPASAADAASWNDVKNQVNSGNNVTITLTNDITATDGLHIGNKNVTIDLNGHTITVANGVGQLFNSWDGQLTIRDSAQITTSVRTVSMPERSNLSATTVNNGTGIGRQASFSNGVLTYYETTSAVRNTIYTTETHKRVDVTVKGGIVRAGNSNAALINIGGGNASVTIEGGFFHNPTGRVLEANNGADVTIFGGVFYGSRIDGNGGAVSVESWNDPRAKFSISNAIFAGNTAVSGGAVATNGKVDMTIGNGAVFSGNRATGSGHDGGGAILIGWDTMATMTGGLVTHNWCTDNVPGASDGNSSYDVCGGGILIRGAMKMTGGQVTSNEAPGGGGIATSFWDGGVFSMTGGIVASNVARLNEGGGITINMNGRGSITGGHITNNRVEGKEHWGGGGIFSSNHSVLTMLSTLIADNKAGGFGGGLAGCSTARVDTHTVELQNHSVAIYNNTAAGTNLSGNNSTKNEDHMFAYSDPVFMREGDYYQDYFSALNTTVCGGFLGYGNALWEGTIDSTVINQGDIEPGEKVTSQSVAGLTSNPSSSDISAAISMAKVFVTGNYAYTHGGGILSNGYMIVGTQRFMELGDRMTLSGGKSLVGGQLKEGQFEFAVADEQGNVLFTGHNNANKEIVFNGRLVFDKAGTYTFKVYELDSDVPNVRKDPVEYTIVVKVTSTKETVYAVDDEDITKTDAVDVTFNKISAVTVYKSTSNQPVLELNKIDKDDRSAYALPSSVLQFQNVISVDTGFEVSKTVQDASGKSANAEFEFTVTLSDTSINGTKGQMNFVDGVATFTLKAGQKKSALDLPAGIKYTITEKPAEGYYNPNPTHSDTVVKDTVQSQTFVNYAVGSLQLSKTVESLSPSDETRDFDFRITLIPGEGRTGAYGATQYNSDGTTSDVDVNFTNGVAIVELKHGESIVINNLPAGKQYSIEELNADGFWVEADNATGDIDVGKTEAAAFINTRQTGELHVRKYVAGAPADTNPEFEFIVTLTDAAYINGTFGDMTFTNGVATVTLGHGEVAKATGLPLGIHYHVAEEHGADYAVSIVGNSNGAITAMPSVVEFTNTAFAGLVISKTTTGSALDRDTSFAFEVTLEDENGQPVSGTYSGVSFVGGKATVYLKDGQSQVIDGLPLGTKVTVKELENERTHHFIIQLNGQNVTDDPTYTHTIVDGDHVHAHFANLHRMGSLEISKQTVSSITADLNRQFVFNVELSAPLNGNFGDMYFVDGKATVYLKHGQVAKAENIPLTATYTVTEQADSAFNSTYVGEASGVITEAGSSVAYTNTRRLGGLKLTKVVQGADSTDAEFGFKVILSPAYNGTVTLGDMTFVNGVAEFTLKAGQSIEAHNIPEGTVYEIIETTYDATNYAPVAGTIMGNITYDVTKEVNFVNRALGTLAVSKRVAGTVIDAAKTFQFTVTLSDATINGTYGGMTFQNGVATFELAHGQSKVATGLPSGITYVVTETADDDYITTSSTGAQGTIATGSAVSANFVNTRKVGGLAVTKHVISDRASDVNQDFTFTVVLSDKSINGSYGDMTFTGGVATFTMKGGQTKTAKGLPSGITYTVAETAANGFTTTYNGETGEIEVNKTAAASITNTREVADLTVSKHVVSDKADDANQKFHFTVALSDHTISGVYGDMSFTGGVASFELKDGESKRAEGLPTGVSYTVVETNVSGFTISSNGATGEIVESGASAEFTNTRSTGDLEVSKRVESSKASDKAEGFEFTVTLNDSSISGVYGEMTFNGGVASFELKDGEKKTATGLPTSVTYTVEEKSAEGFTVTSTGATGTISATKSEASFTNTRKVGELSIGKTVNSALTSDKTRAFRFTVTLNDSSISGLYGELTFNNGVASFNLKAGETKTATGLPVGIGYRVEEEIVEGYTTTYTGTTGTISAVKSEAHFTNTREVGDLEIRKTVVSDKTTDADVSFTFTVTLDDKSISGTYGGVTFENGAATFQLKGGEVVKAEGLPVGVGYTVEETSVEGFTVTSSGATGTISETLAVAAFTNSRETSGLAVSKHVISASAADKNQSFTFTVTLDDKGISGTYGDMTFANGAATFQLKDGETVHAVGLPVGVGYTVTEAAAEGFTTTHNGTMGTISAATATASFTNTRNTGDLEVRKQVVSVSEPDKTKNFHFTVTLSDSSISGTYGDMIFTNGATNFTLKHDEVKKASGLPVGITYEVTETVADAYTSTSTGETGTISATKAEAVFTNTRKTGGLKVTKTVVSADADHQNEHYKFVVTLTDASFLSGTFGEMAFVNGVAEFELGHGETKTATGLPVGIHYTVSEPHEDEGDGHEHNHEYAVSIEGIESGVITESTAAVKFTNTYFSGLVINKQVIGAAQDHDADFTFLITLKDAQGNPVTGQYSGVTFDGKGQAEITLKDGQNLILEGLATGTKATVTETEVDKSHFKVEINGTDKTDDPTFEHVLEAGKSVHAHFVNVHREGSLEISKTTQSMVAADLEREFVFKVTLKVHETDTEALKISGKFGGMFFTEGVATVYLKHGQTVKAEKLPAGVYYTVEEIAVEGFESVSTNETGKLEENATAKVSFQNHRETGSLEVSKRVISASAADKNLAFEFTVTLSENDITGIYGDMTFENGVAIFTLKDGETKTATGLPTNMSYTVTETETEGFTTISNGATGTIRKDETAAAVFTNTRGTSGLTVSKHVSSASAADKNQAFEFTVTLNDKGISGTYGEMTFENSEATFTLKDGETKTASELPTGLTYVVKEKAADGFETTSTGETGVITEKLAVAAFTNTRLTSGLKVTKTVVGDYIDAQKQFTIMVELNDAATNGVYGDMTFTNGVAIFELAHAASKTATGLPVGITYTVTEQADANYTTTYTGKTGTIAQDTVAEAVVTNTVKTGELKVSKTVAGNAADADKKFTFTVTLDAALNKAYGDMTFVNGVATFELGHGESKTATGFPVGIRYTVTEAHSGYVVTVNGTTTDTATGAIRAGETAMADFINTLTQEVGGLKVTKRVAGLDGDKQKAFTFTVTLDDPTINGVYGEMTFVNGVATFTLKDGESKLAGELPVGTGYTVVETADDAYTTVYTGETGTIAKDTILEVQVINSRKTSGLMVSKHVVSANEADKTKEFNFTVTLGDNSINGVFGDMTFIDGIAAFTMMDNEVKTATGLPTGVTYTVAEVEAEGFTTTATGATGVIVDRIAAAYFTNVADGKLSVTKTVEGTAGDKNLPFTFTVTLGDASINGTYGDMTFVDGIATFTLKHGETKTAVNLPADMTYTVTEENGEYVLTKIGDTGTIPAGATAAARFTNTLNTILGDLQVNKTITGNGADLTKKFTFTVTLSDATINGIYGDMEFVNGVAKFELGHNENKTAVGLPAGLGYVVTEEAENYTVTKTGDIGVIPSNKVAVVMFNNDLSYELGGLTVTKTLIGDDANMADRFTFTVKLNVPLTGTYGEMAFVEGVATFDLGHNERKTAEGLPEGIQYTVTEEASTYTVYATGDTGVITAKVTVQAQFVNSRNVIRGGLCVTKTVAGEDGDKQKAFPFTVELLDATINGLYGEMEFVNGVATFTLTDGQTKTASGLPAGVAYRVTEENGTYVVTKTDDTGTIPANDIATAAFINTLSIERGNLRVTKFITGDAADMTRKFTFRVTLSSPITGTYGNMNFTNGVAIVELGHGETAVATRLPAGVQYTVEELDFADYIVTATNEVGVISSDVTHQVTFVNDRPTFEVPDTGDHSMVVLYGAMLMMSAALLCIRGIKARKE